MVYPLTHRVPNASVRLHFGSANPKHKPEQPDVQDAPPVDAEDKTAQAGTSNVLGNLLSFGNRLVQGGTNFYKKHIGFESLDQKIDYYLDKARKDLLKGNINSVFKTFDWAKSKKPDRVETFMQIGQLLSEMVNYKQFGWLNEENRKEQIRGVEFPDLKMAMSHVPLNDLRKEAIKTYEAAHLLDMAKPEPIAELAELYESLGDAEVAKGHLEQLLKLDPQNPDSHAKLGEFFSRQDNLGEAVNKYNQAVQLAPSNDKFLARLGELYYLKGDAQQAEKHLLQAVIRNNTAPEYFITLSKVYTALERHSDANDASLKATELLLEREKQYNPKQLN